MDPETGDIPDTWFPGWPHPGYALGRRLAPEPGLWATFLQDSADMECVCRAPGKTLKFLGYLYGCLDNSLGGHCGHWWQAWRCAECGHEYTDGY